MTDSPILLNLCQEYFRYYHPLPADPFTRYQIKIKLFLREDHSLHLAKPSEFLSKIGVVELRQSAKKTQKCFYYRTDTALFRANPQSGYAVGIVTTKALELPNLLVNTYLFSVLLLLLRFQHRFHLHAAAVISPAKKVHLICGAQRAGKSTLTMAFGVAGWKPISDDGVLLYRDEKDAAKFEAFKREFHVSTELLNRWKQLNEITSQRNYFDRSCIDGLNYFSSEELSSQKYSQFESVIFPVITGDGLSCLQPLSSGEAIQKLIGQSMYFPLQNHLMKKHFEVLGELCSSAKFYTLLAGTDIWENPETLLPICNQLSRSH